MVAEERISQRDAPSREAAVNVAPDSKFRNIVSEVAFISLPGDAGWLGFRRVLKVNGKDIKDAGPPLHVLLTDGAKDDYDQARLLLSASASANLGPPRTTNLPNLPLELLHPRNRHRLHQRIDGDREDSWHRHNAAGGRGALDADDHPAARRRRHAEPVTAWVETKTGRLIRAQVRTSDARIGVLPFDNMIWVDFRADEKLDLLVPYEMKEEFFAGRFREGTGTARYMNYRQFRTAARVVPQ